MLLRRSSCPHVAENPYYHDYINTANQVVEIIQEEGNVNGLFLLRKSFSQPSNFTISVKHEKGLFHIKINQTADGKFQLSDGLSFHSIYHLIKHFSINPITNVEQLQNVYLLRGIMPKRNSWMPRSFSTNSHHQSSISGGVSRGFNGGSMGGVNTGGVNGGSGYGGVNGGSGNGGVNDGSGNGGVNGGSGNDYMEIIDATMQRDNSMTERRIRNQYIQPFLKTSQDPYVRSSDNSDHNAELLSLPADWQAIIKDGSVIYKETVSGERMTELPYNIFTKLSSQQFEKLKRFFHLSTLNNHLQNSTTSSTPTSSTSSTPTSSTPTTPLTPTTSSTSSKSTISIIPRTPTFSKTTTTPKTPTTPTALTTPKIPTTPTTSEISKTPITKSSLAADNYAINHACIELLQNNMTLSPSMSPYLNCQPSTTLNGTVTSPNGTVASPNGTVASPNGTVASPNYSKFIIKGGSLYARMDGAGVNSDQK